MNIIKVATNLILSVIGGLIFIFGFVMEFKSISNYENPLGWMFFFMVLAFIGMGIMYYGVKGTRKELQKGQNVDLDEMKDGDLMEKF